MIQRFEDEKHAEAYNKFRPHYPEKVYEHIISYYEEENKTYNLALDIGCGSGQATIKLAMYFNNVIGVDISKAQISQAPKNIPNIQFLIGQGENLTFCKDESVDLINLATSFHWLEFEIFYKEAKRVLKPNGVLAAYGIGIMSLDLPEATDEIEHFRKDILKPYRHERLQYITVMYNDLILPFRDFRRIGTDVLGMNKVLSIADIIGKIGTYSSYQKYLADNPTSTALDDLQEKLEHIYKEHKEPIMVIWPVFMLLGRK